MTRWLQAARADKTDKTDETRCCETADIPVLSVVSVLSETPNSGHRTQSATVLAFPDTPATPLASTHGRCIITGRIYTWTGRPVTAEEWAGMSAWDRHGSTGQVWNGLTRRWEAAGSEE
jgi:hypothetical protein